MPARHSINNDRENLDQRYFCAVHVVERRSLRLVCVQPATHSNDKMRNASAATAKRF
jgi:hypothetical protein